ncbi:hypothetical protein WEI85_45525 [Actinomycetes bacterium KLBMP 9797]
MAAIAVVQDAGKGPAAREVPEPAFSAFPLLDVAVADDPQRLTGVEWDRRTARLRLFGIDRAAAEAAVASVNEALLARGLPRADVLFVSVNRSLSMLREIVHGVVKDAALLGITPTEARIDPAESRVLVGMTGVATVQRSALFDRYGDAVAVFHQPNRAEPEDGPERYKDRYPYWGGAAIAGWIGTNFSRCTTGFSLRRGGADPKHFAVTAGHCANAYPTGTEFNTLSGTDEWTNVIGTSAGYANTYIGEPFDSGDVTVARTSGGQAVIYNGGVRDAVASTVRSYVEGTPAPDTQMCVSGSTSGRVCGFMVNSGGLYNVVQVGNVFHAVGPLVEVRNPSGGCTTGGDSGGPWYRQVSGGVQAAGVHHGASPADGDGGVCRKRYTALYYPHRAFDAVTLTNP